MLTVHGVIVGARMRKQHKLIYLGCCFLIRASFSDTKAVPSTFDPLIRTYQTTLTCTLNAYGLKYSRVLGQTDLIDACQCSPASPSSTATCQTPHVVTLPVRHETTRLQIQFIAHTRARGIDFAARRHPYLSLPALEQRI